ncbi:Epidermal retinol dehydrogenase 2 [Bagarius yarrelli]|uniref:Epidermal retinol dehydrogenase 2 n=1 Tax=Bagarius yarrelli TaxID=175774 RepID=A0A556V3N4_BAGYA|nr:Epidermal retinol dehydrogenase 2 [Bagarius yarrelli]
MNFLLETLRVLVLSIYHILEAFIKFLLPVGQKSVSGETVLITGAASGIGRIMAIEFANMDVTLVLWDINLDGVKETARMVKKKGARSVHCYQADCSNRDEVYRVAEQVKQEVGDVTILINNAGIVTGKKFMDSPDSLVEKTLQVNAMAHFWMYKAFLPAMTEKNHGHLVCIASSAGLIGVNGLADYCASKFAAVGFAESVALELIATGKNGIKTTIVCPYFINTGMFDGCSTKWPRLLPILEPEYVSKKIMNAILTDQTFLLMPKSMYLLMFLKRQSRHWDQVAVRMQLVKLRRREDAGSHGGSTRHSGAPSITGARAQFFSVLQDLKLRNCTDLLCCVLFVAVLFGYVALGIVDNKCYIRQSDSSGVQSTSAERKFCKGETVVKNEIVSASHISPCAAMLPPAASFTPLHTLLVKRHDLEKALGFRIDRRFNDVTFDDVFISYSNKSILFYFNILKCAHPAVLINLQCSTTQMCVSACPDRFATYMDVWLQHTSNRRGWEYYRQFCRPGFNNAKKPVAHVLRDEDCPSVIMPSKLGITALLEAKQFAMKIVEDFTNSWPWILIGVSGFNGSHDSFNADLLEEESMHRYRFAQRGQQSLHLLKTGQFLSVCTLTVSRFLASSGEAVYKVMSVQPNCKQANLTCIPETFNRTNITKQCPGAQCLFAFYGGESVFHRYIFLLQLFNLLIFLWLVNFTIALGQCTLAGAFASYYWAKRKPEDIPSFPVLSSFFRAIWYHTGSLAFGSLILALVQFIRIVLEYMDHKLKGVIAFFFFTHKIPIIQEKIPVLNNYWLPLLTVVLGSYLIAHGFFSVYATCVDTLFLCFCEDLERNDGTSMKPFLMSPELRGILGIVDQSPRKTRAEPNQSGITD